MLYLVMSDNKSENMMGWGPTAYPELKLTTTACGAPWACKFPGVDRLTQSPPATFNVCTPLLARPVACAVWVRVCHGPRGSAVRSEFGFQNGHEALLSRTSGVIRVTVTSQDRIRAHSVGRAGLLLPF